MRNCNRRFNHNDFGTAGVWYESDCGGDVLGAFRRGRCNDDDVLGAFDQRSRFCNVAGRQAIRSAIQFEDALKECLAALCDNGISPQQFACILDKLADVEKYLVEKIELGKDMAGC